MNKSFSISFVLILYCSIVFAQNNINSYKYILVPKQFEFQKSEDQYQLNSLTKFLFNRAGYNVLFTNEQYPSDLAENNCLALKVVVNNNSSMLTTKLNIDLYDCNNNIVFSTKVGRSREKDFKKSYQEAIRLTFVELEKLNYKYDNNEVSTTKNEIEVKEVISTPKKVQTPKIKKEVAVKEVVLEPVSNDTISVKEKKEVQVKVLKTKNNKLLKSKEKSIAKTIEGKFIFDNWGVSTIYKKGTNYTATGGDEDFEFATIYKTSKPTIFIIKWVAYKQPQLLEMDRDGNLMIDAKNGIKTFKRVN